MRVPVYDRPQVAPGSSPTPNLGRAVDTGMGALGSGIKDLGKAAEALAQAKRAVDTLKLQEALNAYESKINDERIALQRAEGINAAVAYEAGLKSASEIRNELKRSLPGYLQDRFDAQAHGVYERFRVSGANHALKHLRATMGERARVSVENALTTSKDSNLTFENIQELYEQLWAPDGALYAEYTAAGATEDLIAYDKERIARQLHANSIRAKIDAEQWEQAEGHVKLAEEAGLLTKEASAKFKADIEKYAFDAQADQVLMDLMERSKNFAADGRELRDDEKYVRTDLVSAWISEIKDPKLRALVERKWTAIRDEAAQQKTVTASGHYDVVHNQAVRRDGSFLLDRLNKDGLESLEWLRLNDKDTYDRLVARNKMTLDALRKERREAQNLALARAAESARAASQYALFNFKRDILANPERFTVNPNDPDAARKLLAPYVVQGLTNDADRREALKVLLEVNKPDVKAFMHNVKTQVGRVAEYYDPQVRSALEDRVVQRFYSWRGQEGNADKIPDEETMGKWLAEEMMDMGLTVVDDGGSLVTGRRVGQAIGAAGGTWGGIKVGGAAGAVLGPWGAVAGGILGGGIGYFAGGEIGERLGSSSTPAEGGDSTPAQTRDPNAPMEYEVFIRDPVTWQVDQDRVEAAAIAKKYGLPLTESTFQELMGLNNADD